jgi:glutamine phosphoribosylpyrophosphate amidotransferase
MHSVLRRYKDGPVAEARRHHARLLARLVDELLFGSEAPDWWPGGVDAVAAVPSSSRPPVAGRLPCPVGDVMAESHALRQLPSVSLGRGPGRARHLRASANAFAPQGPVGGRRLLVFDDTWVTGARARSAAAALTAAGADVVGVLVLGRTVDPDASPALSAWWASHGPRRA